MKIIEAIKPFEIQEIRLNEWTARPVKNNFFEVVLINQGSGTQCINYKIYSYKKGSIFLLPPLQCHSFNITEPTEFIFLKFTDSFFKNNQQLSIDNNDWFKEAAYILSNYNQLPGDIIKNESDRGHIEKLIQIILQEASNNTEESTLLIKSLMTGILEILIRNIKQGTYYDISDKNAGERINSMLTYINENIDKPNLLKVDNLADIFAMSTTYVSEFFRKHTHQSLREYIIKSKLKLVEIKLLNSDQTLTEIAFDLGFTDVSHLSKTYKRYADISIRDFKKQREYVLLKRNAC